VSACLSSMTLVVRALTIVVNLTLGVEAMADKGRGELGEMVSVVVQPQVDQGREDRGQTRVCVVLGGPDGGC